LTPGPYIEAGEVIVYAATAVFVVPDCEHVADNETSKVEYVYCVTDEDAILFTPPMDATTYGV